jgi:hypothetical protein
MNCEELRKEIVLKNLLLDSLVNEADTDKERIKSIKHELDCLLYQYFKLIRPG